MGLVRGRADGATRHLDGVGCRERRDYAELEAGRRIPGRARPRHGGGPVTTNLVGEPYARVESMTWRQFRMMKVSRLLLVAALFALSALIVAGCGKEKKENDQESFAFVTYPGSRYLAQLTDLWKQAHRVI